MIILLGFFLFLMIILLIFRKKEEYKVDNPYIRERDFDNDEEIIAADCEAVLGCYGGGTIDE